MRRTLSPNLYRYWLKVFSKSGISAGEAKVSLEQILEKVTGRNKRSTMSRNSFPMVSLSPTQIKQFNEFCQKRATRMPLQYILEEWDFHHISLKLKPPCFIPRAETEELVDIVLSHLEQHRKGTGRSEVGIFEVGCGSGAISLAIAAACSEVKCIAIDKSIHAVGLARENAAILNLDKRVQIYYGELSASGTVSSDDAHYIREQKFDIVCSNPPYIRTDEKDDLDPEVIRYEDHDALFGGHDGLDVVRSILKFSKRHLKDKGQVFLEVGLSQPPIIRDILNSSDYRMFQLVHVYPDHTARDRFVQICLTTSHCM